MANLYTKFNIRHATPVNNSPFQSNAASIVKIHVKKKPIQKNIFEIQDHFFFGKEVFPSIKIFSFHVNPFIKQSCTLYKHTRQVRKHPPLSLFLCHLTPGPYKVPSCKDE